MRRKAIIAAAGWKGAGREEELAGCPECFLPLGNGTTSLSRLSAQLTNLDFDIYIAIGELGYPFGKYMWRYQKVPDGEGARSVDVFLEQMGLSPSDSPWTQERLDYAAQLGTVIQISNPGRGNSHDTFCIVLDMIGEESWDDILMVQGDMVLPEKFLAQIVDLPKPCQYQLCPNHSIFLLDKKGSTFYRGFCERPHMREGCDLLRDWKVICSQYPNGHPHGTGILQDEGGIKKRAPFNTPSGPIPLRFIDIDSVRSYDGAKKAIANGSVNTLMPKRKD